MSRGRPSSAAGNLPADGAKMIAEGGRRQLVPRGVAAGKPGRILAAGRRHVVVHQRDGIHQQIPDSRPPERASSARDQVDHDLIGPATCQAPRRTPAPVAHDNDFRRRSPPRSCRRGARRDGGSAPRCTACSRRPASPSRRSCRRSAAVAFAEQRLGQDDDRALAQVVGARLEAETQQPDALLAGLEHLVDRALDLQPVAGENRLRSPAARRRLPWRGTAARGHPWAGTNRRTRSPASGSTATGSACRRGRRRP